MGKIIAVANQKGGVGKTTTSVNLSSLLAKKGKKVVLLDADPQGNATSGLGVDKNVEKSLYDVLVNEEPVENTLQDTIEKNLKICPSNVNLAGAEVELVSQMSREHRLKEQLDQIKDKYDYIFIDCPPSLGLITLNSFTAADSVLIPVQCEYYALEGLGQLINTINLVKKHLNKSLEIEGAVLTMYDIRTNLSNQVVKEVYNYAKVHSQVNFFDWQNGNLIYEKQQSMMESRQEKLFTVVSMIVNVITMLMCVIFILFEKAQSDYSEMEWKYRFYKNCGMSSEKRRKSVCKEVLISERLVLLYGISLGMLAIVTKILFKGMSPRWSIIYLVGAVSFSALIALIVCIVMRITAWRIFRKIERNS